MAENTNTNKRSAANDKETIYSFSGADISIFVLPPNEIVNQKQETITELDPIYENDNGDSDYRLNYKEVTTNPTLDHALIQVNNIQTFSYSIYRDKEAVRVLGQVNPVGFTRGQITLAGTIIFTVTFGKILHELFQYAQQDGFIKYPNLQRIDQLPPLDFMLVFNNEYGAVSRMVIYGVEFMNEGQVMSIQDLMTENSVNYMARDFSPMTPVNKPFDYGGAVSKTIQQLSDDAHKDAYNYMNDFRRLFI